MDLIFKLISSLVVLAIVLGLTKLFESKQSSNKDNGESSKDVKDLKFFKKRLLTPTEISFFNLLLQATPGRYIFTQVALSQLIGVPSGSQKQSSFNRINRMSIDFVVCDAQLNTLLAIELDDPSHDRSPSIERDLKKDTVLATAGVRLVRLRVEAIPSLEVLKKLLALD